MTEANETAGYSFRALNCFISQKFPSDFPATFPRRAAEHKGRLIFREQMLLLASYVPLYLFRKNSSRKEKRNMLLHIRTLMLDKR